MANTSTQYVEKWLKLNQEGHFQEAKGPDRRSIQERGRTILDTRVHT